LKKALQPSVTDLEVEFDLPSGFEAFQAPSNVPSLFKGDKVVIYGILKTKAASDSPLESGVQGKAFLKGHISGKTLLHSISFDIPAPLLMGEDQLESSSGFDLPVIHHLAAKSLLRDWKAGKGWGSTALTQEREQESVNISIESSVICEHTAFVAVDQEKKQPIEGAMTTYDITASMVVKDFESMPKYDITASMVVKDVESIPEDRLVLHPSKYDCVGSFVSEVEDSSDSSFEFLDSPPLGGPSPPAMGFGGAPPPTMGYSSPPPPAMAFNVSQSQMSSFSFAPAPARFKAAPSPSAPLRQPRSDLSSPSNRGYDLASNLISLQHASGYWLLEDISEKILKKSLPELQCPSDVTRDAWATILALVYLELKLGAQKDEWELIEAKAEMWLSHQLLPSSLESLKQRAKTFI